MKTKIPVILFFFSFLAQLAIGENRIIDGTGNNLFHTDWGSTGTELLRTEPADYADGNSSPAGENRASPRLISNVALNQNESKENIFGQSDYLWVWGQFIVHETSLTENEVPAEPFPIIVPPGDQIFDPNFTGEEILNFNRSAYKAGVTRQQLNSVTAWLDASAIYGSNGARADWLRTHMGGRMKVTTSQTGDLLPFNDGTIPNNGGTGTNLFVAGDVRANENVTLLTLHTLFVREHNKLAGQIEANNPSWTDEQIYQKIRKIVGGELQAITYNEFLPVLLGEDVPDEYSGYNPEVNPSILNVFSTAAFRFVDSAISPEILRLNSQNKIIPEGNLPIENIFFNPGAITNQGGIEPLLRGLASQLHQEIDAEIIGALRNRDLESTNIQRGRDHGLPSYNQLRLFWELETFGNINELNAIPKVQAALKAVYGSINNIDAFVGMLAENEESGTLSGGLRNTIIKDQFARLRDGDRFWYQNDSSLTASEKTFISNFTLKQLIERNTSIRNLQENVFYAEDFTPPPPEGDLLTIDTARIYEYPTMQYMYIMGGSLDATIENWLQSSVMEIRIFGDDNPTPVITSSIPISGFKYSQGKLTYQGSTPVAYVQLDPAAKTFTLAATHEDLSSVLASASLEIKIGTYLGQGTNNLSE